MSDHNSRFTVHDLDMFAFEVMRSWARRFFNGGEPIEVSEFSVLEVAVRMEVIIKTENACVTKDALTLGVRVDMGLGRDAAARKVDFALSKKWLTRRRGPGNSYDYRLSPLGRDLYRNIIDIERVLRKVIEEQCANPENERAGYQLLVEFGGLEGKRLAEQVYFNAWHHPSAERISMGAYLDRLHKKLDEQHRENFDETHEEHVMNSVYLSATTCTTNGGQRQNDKGADKGGLV